MCDRFLPFIPPSHHQCAALKRPILYRVKTLSNPNTAYKNFFIIFFEIYNKYFPKVKIKIKTKTIQNPWFTKALQSPLSRNKGSMNSFLKIILQRISIGSSKLVLELVRTRVLESLAGCCAMFLFAVFCKIGALESNAY